MSYDEKRLSHVFEPGKLEITPAGDHTGAWISLHGTPTYNSYAEDLGDEVKPHTWFTPATVALEAASACRRGRRVQCKLDSNVYVTFPSIESSIEAFEFGRRSDGVYELKACYDSLQGEELIIEFYSRLEREQALDLADKLERAARDAIVKAARVLAGEADAA